MRSQLGMSVLLLAAFGAPVAHATTTYVYTGNDFASAVSPYTTSDSVTGFFSIATLGANLSDVTISPTSYSFSDGVQTLTDQISGITGQFEHFTTDSSGNITGWQIYLLPPTTSQIFTSSLGGGEDFGQTSGPVYGVVFSAPGTWVTVTPEPTSVVLMSTGLLALAFVVRKRRAQATRCARDNDVGDVCSPGPASTI